MAETPDLKLYNTLTREKAPFTPIDASNVRMYVCGPTVYDFAHIGNARPVIVFDLLFRLLRHVYGAEHVTYVRNITDVDDKINARAARDFPGLPLNEAIRRVTETTATQFQKDATALGCLPPTIEPRATEFVLPRDDGRTDMVSLISMLISNGHAYEASGEVLFDVGSMPDYGKLSRRPLEDNQAGARIAVEAHKKNPADFVLWKQSSENEPGWQSPWGRGRPGWHIECSAMSAAYLGKVFDIHGGGLDLIFPHHENEIAQSRCAHGTHAMANVWMHNGFLQVEGKKMSKSEGNFVTINDLLATDKFGGRSWIGPILRLAMLMTHYREPVDFSVARLEEAATIFRSFAAVVRDFVFSPTVDEVVLEKLSDDLDTPAVIARLVELRDKATAHDVEAGRSLLGSLRLIGFFEAAFAVKTTITYPEVDLVGVSPSEFVSANTHLSLDTPVSIIEATISKSHPEDGRVIYEALAGFSSRSLWVDVLDVTKRSGLEALLGRIKERLAALNAKDFATADKIRAELLAEGIQLKDGKDASGNRITTWEIRK